MVERIQNGDFSISTGGTDADPTGWTVNETDSLQVQVISTNGRLAFNRSGSPAGSSIEQTIPNVFIGKAINFSMNYYENGNGGDPSVLVEILDGNNNVIFSQVVSTNPTLVSYSFTAASSSYTVRITDTSTGNLTGHDAHIDNVSFDVACFARGTLIETADGPMPIEEIRQGQLIRTADNGNQPVRWICSRRLDDTDLARNPELRPIVFPKGSLGGGLPERELRVSPQHRMMLRSRIVRRMFDCDEILVAAKKLIGQYGIAVDTDAHSVEYFHMLFDVHQVVYSNGAATESLFGGPMALNTLGRDVVAEIRKLFPEIDLTGNSSTPARSIVAGRRVHRLIDRHVQNRNPLFDIRRALSGCVANFPVS